LSGRSFIIAAMKAMVLCAGFGTRLGDLNRTAVRLSAGGLPLRD
jgi:choline kinase